MSREHSRSFGVEFSSEERRRAVELYAQLHSLSKVAAELKRSPTGVYKILKQESCQVSSNVKVRAREKEEIQRLYYKECYSSTEVALELGISKTTVKYWLRRLGTPVPESSRLQAGTKSPQFCSGLVDLLPLVERSHLRWVDDCWIHLRTGNSHKVLLCRQVDASRFAYVLGFYLAEGNKGKGPPDLRNTNSELMQGYLAILKSVVHSDFRIYDFPESGKRRERLSIGVGGGCMKHLLLNGIESLLSLFSAEPKHLSSEVRDLGLAFLNGCADGDGSISRAIQPRTRKSRVSFYLTEGNRGYALRLGRMFRGILEAGYVYRPRNRNYYLVIASLSPERAALLLEHGFFSQHPIMRMRLASKALDSKYLARFVRLYSLFGSSQFSSADIIRFAPEVTKDFVGKAVVRKHLLPVGVDPTRFRLGPKWCRQYQIASEMRDIAKCIAYSTADGKAALGSESSLWDIR